MPKRKTSPLLVLVNNFKLAFLKKLLTVARKSENRSRLAGKILKHLDPTGQRQLSDTNRIAEKIGDLEEQGLISIRQQVIHPAQSSKEDNIDQLENSVIRSLREIDNLAFDEQTDVYLDRLRRADGIFSWRQTFLYRIKVYLENFIFFWRTPSLRHYNLVSSLAERFIEWETKIFIKSPGPDDFPQLKHYFEKANAIDSSTILKRTSFGQANDEPLGDQPVFIISDLHLATGSKFDRFNKTAKLVRFLKVVEKLDAVLIVNGDFFDFWQASLKNVFIKYKEIIWELLRIKRVILIVGNHDQWLANFQDQRFLMPNISILESFYDPGNNLYIEHGHRGDPINKSLAGEILARFVMNAEKLSRTHLLEKVEYLARTLTPSRMGYRHQVTSYINRMAEIYYDELKLLPQQGQLRPLRIVFGHIHYRNYLRTIAHIKEELKTTLPEVEFISSGHWTDVNPIFLFMKSGNISSLTLQGGIQEFLQTIRTNDFNR